MAVETRQGTQRNPLVTADGGATQAEDLIVRASAPTAPVASAITSARSIAGRQVMGYEGRQQIIRDIVHIAQASDSGQVSAPGDSGAWWLDTAHRAVGLHFAGSDHPEYGLAIAMPQVLDALNVDIATDQQVRFTSA